MTTKTAPPIAQVAALLSRRVVRAAPTHGLTTKQLRDAAGGRYKPYVADALRYAVEQQWITEHAFTARNHQDGARYKAGPLAQDIPRAPIPPVAPQATQEEDTPVFENFTPQPYELHAHTQGQMWLVLGWVPGDTLRAVAVRWNKADSMTTAGSPVLLDSPTFSVPLSSS